jgi:shikimate dehydrogenase
MIKADTKICCLIGNPVEHSLSPLIHNTGYQALGLNFAYTAFKVEDVEKAIEGIRGLGIRGVSITIPHKVSAMKYIDEIDDIAKEVGAINTIVNNDGVLYGFNTDYSAVLKALKEKTVVEGKRAVLLGAGGAALAIASGLKKNGVEMMILDRPVEQAEKLARKVGSAGFGGFDQVSEISSANILINATPAGMWPKVDESLVPKELLHPKLAVFDIVYNPLETKLIAEAKEAGCTVILGHKMFLYQGTEQFELFTGHEAPVSVMEEVLLKALEGG